MSEDKKRAIRNARAKEARIRREAGVNIHLPEWQAKIAKANEEYLRALRMR